MKKLVYRRNLATDRQVPTTISISLTHSFAISDALRSFFSCPFSGRWVTSYFVCIAFYRSFRIKGTFLSDFLAVPLQLCHTICLKMGLPDKMSGKKIENKGNRFRLHWPHMPIYFRVGQETTFHCPFSHRALNESNTAGPHVCVSVCVCAVISDVCNGNVAPGRHVSFSQSRTDRFEWCEQGRVVQLLSAITFFSVPHTHTRTHKKIKTAEAVSKFCRCAATKEGTTTRRCPRSFARVVMKARTRWCITVGLRTKANVEVQ